VSVAALRRRLSPLPFRPPTHERPLLPAPSENEGERYEEGITAAPLADACPEEEEKGEEEEDEEEEEEEEEAAGLT